MHSFPLSIAKEFILWNMLAVMPSAAHREPFGSRKRFMIIVLPIPLSPYMAIRASAHATETTDVTLSQGEHLILRHYPRRQLAEMEPIQTAIRSVETTFPTTPPALGDRRSLHSGPPLNRGSCRLR